MLNEGMMNEAGKGREKREELDRGRNEATKDRRKRMGRNEAGKGREDEFKKKTGRGTEGQEGGHEKEEE